MLCYSFQPFFVSVRHTHTKKKRMQRRPALLLSLLLLVFSFSRKVGKTYHCRNLKVHKKQSIRIKRLEQVEIASYFGFSEQNTVIISLSLQTKTMFVMHVNKLVTRQPKDGSYQCKHLASR